MFAVHKHKFTGDEHMFMDGEHKFLVHEHKINHSLFLSSAGLSVVALAI